MKIDHKCSKNYIKQLIEILGNGHPMDCAEAALKLGLCHRKSTSALSVMSKAFNKHFDCYPLCHHTLIAVRNIGVWNQNVQEILVRSFDHSDRRILDEAKEAITFFHSQRIAVGGEITAKILLDKIDSPK